LDGTFIGDTPVMQGGTKGMTEEEAQALGELLRDLERRVKRLQEALDHRFDAPVPRDWLSVGERLAALEEDPG
jgi:hypothetical protein